MIITLSVKTSTRTEMLDITREVKRAVDESGVKDGLCCVYNPHTTAGITINEGADPSVVRDMTVALGTLVPREGNYRHSEGNSDAHIKASVVGSSQTILIQRGKLLLGTWQSIFFCEFDGPRTRKAMVKVIDSA